MYNYWQGIWPWRIPCTWSSTDWQRAPAQQHFPLAWNVVVNVAVNWITADHWHYDYYCCYLLCWDKSWKFWGRWEMMEGEVINEGFEGGEKWGFWGRWEMRVLRGGGRNEGFFLGGGGWGFWGKGEMREGGYDGFEGVEIWGGRWQMMVLRKGRSGGFEGREKLGFWGRGEMRVLRKGRNEGFEGGEKWGFWGEGRN